MLKSLRIGLSPFSFVTKSPLVLYLGHVYDFDMFYEVSEYFKL